MCSRSVLPLSQLEVLVIDCQATAAAPRGHLLEIAWAGRSEPSRTLRAHLVALPEDETIPPAVARITGISEAMVREGVDRPLAWRELADDAARLTVQPPPTVIHFARFEQPFLRALARGEPPLDIVCTHDIACRLFPDLPRRGLRALAGYLGGGLGVLRRSADHVEATAFLWQRLVQRLEDEGVATWAALREWLATPVASLRHPRRVWPMPRETRLSLPKHPGVYRMLRTTGDVLYVGKASSLHHRVNSYFRKQHGGDERMLEMLTQARAISFEVTATPLEAALLEADEIKRCLPPVQSRPDGRRTRPVVRVAGSQRPESTAVAIVPRSDRSHQPTHWTNSPPSRERTTPLSARVAGAPIRRRSSPGTSVPRAHPELSRVDLSPQARLLRLGTRLWREGRRDRDADDEDAPDGGRRVTAWTPELVQPRSSG